MWNIENECSVVMEEDYCGFYYWLGYCNPFRCSRIDLIFATPCFSVIVIVISNFLGALILVGAFRYGLRSNFFVDLNLFEDISQKRLKVVY